MWWTKDITTWSKEEAEDAQSAYYQTFLAASIGRKVLAHLRLLSHTMIKPELKGESALVTLTLKDFVDLIRQNCGPEDELARIKTESKSAAAIANWQPPESMEKSLEGFSNEL